MHSLFPTHWLLAAALLTAILLSRFLALSIHTWRRAKHFRLENGCYPVHTQYPAWGKLFATDFVLAQLRAGDEHRFLRTQAERFDDLRATTFGVRPLGQQFFMTIDPANVQAVLSGKFADFGFGERLAILGPLMGRGIFTTEGAEWSHSRAMLRPRFVREYVADLRVLEKGMGRLLGLIPGDGETVDLQELFQRFTVDSVMEFLFAHCPDALGGEDSPDKQFGEAMSIALEECSLLSRFGPLKRFRRNRAAALARKQCRAHVERFIDDALEHKNDSNTQRSFIQDLAEITNDRGKIRDELMNILVAGRDTTSSLLASLFYFLARHPLVWQKVRDEVAHRLQGELPNYTTLRDLQYCRFCIQETLRLLPPVPTNSRVALRDTVLPRGGGPDGQTPLHVPKGSTVQYHVFAMHRRKDFFGEDAEDFRPERWHGKKHSWEFLPFNGGPRICLGQQYALTEATYVLVRMAQNFESLQPRDDVPWTEQLMLTVRSRYGVKLALTAG